MQMALCSRRSSCLGASKEFSFLKSYLARIGSLTIKGSFFSGVESFYFILQMSLLKNEADDVGKCHEKIVSKSQSPLVPAGIVNLSTVQCDCVWIHVYCFQLHLLLLLVLVPSICSSKVFFEVVFLDNLNAGLLPIIVFMHSSIATYDLSTSSTTAH